MTELSDVQVRILRTLSASRAMTPSTLIVEGQLHPDHAVEALSTLRKLGYVSEQTPKQLDEPIYALTSSGGRLLRTRV